MEIHRNHLHESLNEDKIIEQFSDEVDEEAKEEVISCKVCLVNTLKVVFSCGHCTWISCANKLMIVICIGKKFQKRLDYIYEMKK